MSIENIALKAAWFADMRAIHRDRVQAPFLLDQYATGWVVRDESTGDINRYPTFAQAYGVWMDLMIAATKNKSGNVDLLESSEK